MSTLKKSLTKIADACACKNFFQLSRDLSGAGPIRFVLKSFRIAVADTRNPSLISSPWMRTQPYPGLSLAISKISFWSSGSRRGRPGPRRFRKAAHFRRTNCRCQPSTVSG